MPKYRVSTNWAAIAVAGVPAFVSLAGAAVASFEARRARLAEQELERLRQLEERVSAHKYEVYEPMIEMLDQLTSDVSVDDSEIRFTEFRRWIMIFGSDETVVADGRLMQCLFEHAPAGILLRMYAEFVLAARRDMGDSNSDITALDFYAAKVNDLYAGRVNYEVQADPLDRVFDRLGWVAPWKRDREDMHDTA